MLLKLIFLFLDNSENGKGGVITYNDPEAAKALNDSEKGTPGNKKVSIPNKLMKNSQKSKHNHQQNIDMGNKNSQSSDKVVVENSEEDRQEGGAICSGTQDPNDVNPEAKSNTHQSEKSTKTQRQDTRVSILEAKPETKKTRDIPEAIHGAPNTGQLTRPKMNDSGSTSGAGSNQPRYLPPRPTSQSQGSISSRKQNQNSEVTGKSCRPKSSKGPSKSDEEDYKPGNCSKIKNKAEIKKQEMNLNTSSFEVAAPSRSSVNTVDTNSGKENRGRNNKVTSVSTNSKQNKAEKQKDGKASTVSPKSTPPKSSADARNSTPTSSRPQNDENSSEKKQQQSKKEPAAIAEKLDTVYPINIKSQKTEMAGLEVDVIVSSEDGTLQGNGMVAKHLEKKGGKVYAQLKKQTLELCHMNLPQWEFTSSPSAGSLKCKRVFHAHVLSIQNVRSEDEWCNMLETLYFNLLVRTDVMGFTSIALPLLGTGTYKAPFMFLKQLQFDNM